MTCCHDPYSSENRRSWTPSLCFAGFLWCVVYCNNHRSLDVFFYTYVPTALMLSLPHCCNIFSFYYHPSPPPPAPDTHTQTHLASPLPCLPPPQHVRLVVRNSNHLQCVTACSPPPPLHSPRLEGWKKRACIRNVLSRRRFITRHTTPLSCQSRQLNVRRGVWAENNLQ